MKKFTVVLAALLAVCFAAPAFAADNLELGGQFYLTGWDQSDSGFTKDNDSSYFKQRMRIKAKIKASDNAFVVIRGDIAEGVWGRDIQDVGGGWYRASAGTNSNIHFDRAYGVFQNDTFALSMGLQYLGLGVGEVVDGQYTMAKLRLKFGMVEPSIFYGKLDEGASLNDDSKANEDADLYGINLSFDAAGFDSNAFYALAKDDSDDSEMWVFGAHTSGKVGMVNLTAELDFLGGDKTANVDYKGTQFYVGADVDVNDMLNVGAQFLYAAGQDGSDEQLTGLSNADTFNFVDYNAPCANDVVIFGSVYDFTGEGAGVIGASLFGSYKVMPQLAFGAKVGYLTAEDDDKASLEFDAAATYTLWGAYDLGSNTQFLLLYNIADPDGTNGNDPEAWNTLYAKFTINF